MIILKKVFYIIISSLILISCAKPGGLSGGPKDTTPPKLVENKSTANFQTNFVPENITLYFNEWINLKNKNQILISPPLNKKSKISSRGKHVDLVFDKKDTLKENTTYTINFGKSIVDFTEGNPASNFVYIFSTGDEIDSLEIKGKVINSLDKKPLKDITILLYDTNEDSIVVKSKPYYFAITDKSGNFKITHIKEGYFKVFALKDGNANYLYDQETEQIGYLDSMILIQDDSIKIDLTIKMFTPTPSLRILDKSIVGFGKIKIEYNRKPDSIRITNSSVEIFKEEIINDSLLIWYDNINKNDSINLVIKNEDKIDTLIFKLRKQFSKPIPLLLIKNKSLQLHPNSQLFLEFNQGVIVNDTTKLSLFEELIKEIEDTSISTKFDTIITKINYSFAVNSTNNRIYSIKGDWKENKKYKLTILPGYFKSLYDVENDSIDLNISIDKKEDYGNLTCLVDSLDSNIVYIAILKNGKKVIKQERIINKMKTKLDFGALLPGKYSLEIILDSNDNGRWDGGDYFKKQKAEKRYTFSLSDLKANWNQEENINLKQKDKDDTKK